MIWYRMVWLICNLGSDMWSGRGTGRYGIAGMPQGAISDFIPGVAGSHKREFLLFNSQNLDYFREFSPSGREFPKIIEILNSLLMGITSLTEREQRDCLSGIDIHI